MSSVNSLSFDFFNFDSAVHESRQCSVCFDDFKQNEEFMAHPDSSQPSSEEEQPQPKYSHYFHEDCLTKWVLEKLKNAPQATCPVCRGLIAQEDGADGVEEQAHAAEEESDSDEQIEEQIPNLELVENLIALGPNQPLAPEQAAAINQQLQAGIAQMMALLDQEDSF